MAGLQSEALLLLCDLAPDAAEATACAEADDDDSGFWDLVSILYPEAVEAAGVTTMRELVPRWEPLEKMLMVGVSTGRGPACLLPCACSTALYTDEMCSSICLSQWAGQWRRASRCMSARHCNPGGCACRPSTAGGPLLLQSRGLQLPRGCCPP